MELLMDHVTIVQVVDSTPIELTFFLRGNYLQRGKMYLIEEYEGKNTISKCIRLVAVNIL